MRGELIALAIVVVAVVIRGWPRRRSDRWSFMMKLERDRSDDKDKKKRPPTG